MKKRYLYLYIISVMMINTITYFPYIILNKLEKGFPYAILIGFFIISVLTILLVKTYNRFEGLSLIEISNTLFGRKIGSILSLLFIAVCFSEGYMLFVSTIAISQKIVMVTSSSYLMAFFILVVVICCLLNNEKTMLIIISFFTFMFILEYPAILAITFREVDFRFMEGAIRHSMSLPPLQSIAFATFFFAGIENLALYNVAFKKTNSLSPILLYSCIGIPVAFLTILIPVGIWGDVAVKSLKLPTLITNDTIGIDLFVIERALFIVFPLYFIISVIGTVNYLYVSLGLLKKLINNTKIYQGVASILLLCLLLLSKNSGHFLSMMDFAKVWGVLWFFFIIIFSLLLYIFSKKGVKKYK